MTYPEYWERQEREHSFDELVRKAVRLRMIEAQRDILVRTIIEAPHKGHSYDHDRIRLDCQLCAIVQAFRPYRTKTGRILTDAEIEALADEAERGYEIDPPHFYVYAIAFDQDTFGIFATREAAEKSLARQIEDGGPAWGDCKIERWRIEGEPEFTGSTPRPLPKESK